MEVLHSVEPGNPKLLFLRFPFKAPAETINQVTEGLTIFDHPFFKFENEEDEMQPLIHLEYGKIKALPFSSTMIFNQIYMDLKHDISAGSGKMWFNDELINFYSCWLLRTNDPPHIKATEILDTLLVRAINDMYKFHDGIHAGIENEKRLKAAMKHILQFLETHHDILSKKLIFFSINIIKNHWWGCCAINPWYHMYQVLQKQQLVRDKKTKKTDKVDQICLWISGL